MKSNVENQVDNLIEKLDSEIYSNLRGFFLLSLSNKQISKRNEKLPFAEGVFIAENDFRNITDLANNIIDGTKGDVVSIYDKDGIKIAVGIYWRLTGIEYTTSNERKRLLLDKDIIYCKVIHENIYVFKCKR